VNTKKTYEPIPAGGYVVKMNRLEEKPTKAGDTMLSASFQVVDGDFTNRLLFHNFIIEHSNPRVAEIGNDQLDNFLKSVGLEGGFEALGYDRSRLGDYLNKMLKVKVKIEEGTNGYSDRNKITSFKGI
jgi:hypothetical protein